MPSALRRIAVLPQYGPRGTAFLFFFFKRFPPKKAGRLPTIEHHTGGQPAWYPICKATFRHLYIYRWTYHIGSLIADIRTDFRAPPGDVWRRELFRRTDDLGMYPCLSHIIPYVPICFNTFRHNRLLFTFHSQPAVWFCASFRYLSMLVSNK